MCVRSYREARREVGRLAELLAGGEEAAVLIEESTATVALVIGRMGGTAASAATCCPAGDALLVDGAGQHSCTQTGAQVRYMSASRKSVGFF
jgi:hypothetical protein